MRLILRWQVPARRPAPADLTPPVVVLEGSADPDALVALQWEIVDAVDLGHERVILDVDAANGMAPRLRQLLCRALEDLGRHGVKVVIARAGIRVRRLIESRQFEHVEFYPESSQLQHVSSAWGETVNAGGSASP